MKVIALWIGETDIYLSLPEYTKVSLRVAVERVDYGFSYYDMTFILVAEQLRTPVAQL